MRIFEPLNKDTANTVPINTPVGANAQATPLLFYVVPDFVSSAMRRSKLNTVDISRFRALSGVLTSEDFANWAIEVDWVNGLVVQNIRVLEPCVGLESYWQNVTLEDRSFIQREILPLTYFPQRKSDVHTRLTETQGTDGAMNAGIRQRFVAQIVVNLPKQYASFYGVFDGNRRHKKPLIKRQIAAEITSDFVSNRR
jgi:hypothetical protein